MDDLITLFFQNTFTEEQQTLLYKGLGLMTVFGFPNYGEEIVHIVMQEGEQHKETITDQVYNHIESGVDTLISAHRIQLEGDPTMGYKVAIMEAIYGLGYREDYSSYALILEDMELSNEEKFAEILSDIAGISADDIMEHLSWVFEGTLDRLKTLIQAKQVEEVSAEDINLLKKIRRHLIIFETCFGVPQALTSLQELGMIKGASFDSYLQLLGDELVDYGDVESTTWRLLWLALISSDGTDNPQKLLKEKISSIYGDLQLQNQFTTMLQKAMGHYQEHKEHLK